MSSSPAATARSPAISSACSPTHGHHGRGLIRNPDHAADLEADGAVPVLCDLEHDDPRPHLGAADAIVFAAGAGPGSGPERKRTVDYGGAVKLIEAAEELGVRRYLMVSSMGAGDPASASEAMRPYQQAKHDADEALAASGLDWTIVRPGAAHRRAGQRPRRRSARRSGRYGQIPREDVALVLLECSGGATPCAGRSRCSRATCRSRGRGAQRRLLDGPRCTEVALRAPGPIVRLRP